MINVELGLIDNLQIIAEHTGQSGEDIRQLAAKFISMGLDSSEVLMRTKAAALLMKVCHLNWSEAFTSTCEILALN
jgi:hypothetical protein